MPSWSRDGKKIYFTSNYSGRWEIYRQAVAGGDPVAITHTGGMRAVESWNGRNLYIHRGEPLGGILSIPIDDTSHSDSGNVEGKVFLSELTGGMWGDWSVGPQGIVFLKPSVSGNAETIVAFDPETGSRRQVAAFNGNSPEGDLIFSVDPAQQSFLYVKTEVSDSDIGMLERHN